MKRGRDDGDCAFHAWRDLFGELQNEIATRFLDAGTRESLAHTCRAAYEKWHVSDVNIGEDAHWTYIVRYMVLRRRDALGEILVGMARAKRDPADLCWFMDVFAAVPSPWWTCLLPHRRAPHAWKAWKVSLAVRTLVNHSHAAGLRALLAHPSCPTTTVFTECAIAESRDVPFLVEIDSILFASSTYRHSIIINNLLEEEDPDWALLLCMPSWQKWLSMYSTREFPRRVRKLYIPSLCSLWPWLPRDLQRQLLHDASWVKQCRLAVDYADTRVNQAALLVECIPELAPWDVPGMIGGHANNIVNLFATPTDARLATLEWLHARGLLEFRRPPPRDEARMYGDAVVVFSNSDHRLATEAAHAWLLAHPFPGSAFLLTLCAAGLAAQQWS